MGLVGFTSGFFYYTFSNLIIGDSRVSILERDIKGFGKLRVWRLLFVDVVHFVSWRVAGLIICQMI